MANIPIPSPYMPDPLTGPEAFRAGASIGPATSGFVQGVQGLLQGIGQGQSIVSSALEAKDRYGIEARLSRQQKAKLEQEAHQLKKDELAFRKEKLKSDIEIDLLKNSTDLKRISTDLTIARMHAMNQRQKMSTEEEDAIVLNHVMDAYDVFKDSGNADTLLSLNGTNKLLAMKVNKVLAKSPNLRDNILSDMGEAIDSGNMSPEQVQMANNFIDTVGRSGKAYTNAKRAEQAALKINDFYGVMPDTKAILDSKTLLKLPDSADNPIYNIPGLGEKTPAKSNSGNPSDIEKALNTYINSINEIIKVSSGPTDIAARETQKAITASTGGLISPEEAPVKIAVKKAEGVEEFKVPQIKNAQTVISKNGRVVTTGDIDMSDMRNDNIPAPSRKESYLNRIKGQK